MFIYYVKSLVICFVLFVDFDIFNHAKASSFFNIFINIYIHVCMINHFSCADVLIYIAVILCVENSEVMHFTELLAG